MPRVDGVGARRPDPPHIRTTSAYHQSPRNAAMKACDYGTRVRAAFAAALLLGAAACNRAQRTPVDTSISSAGEVARTALSVIDVDMGRHVNADRKITDKT